MGHISNPGLRREIAALSQIVARLRGVRA